MTRIEGEFSSTTDEPNFITQEQLKTFKPPEQLLLSSLNARVQMRWPLTKQKTQANYKFRQNDSTKSKKVQPDTRIHLLLLQARWGCHNTRAEENNFFNSIEDELTSNLSLDNTIVKYVYFA